MSVLIKGMKMPEECCVCDFMVNGMRCSALKFCDVDDAILRGERYADCPLIEIPEHGDLVDVNELESWIENWFYKERYYHPYSKGKTIPTEELRDIIKSVPVIIPAERSEE